MTSNKTLNKHLSMAGAWAFSIGTSIGWGSLVVTASTYLVQAGPVGSALGLFAGMIVMIIIAMNYAYMIRCFPEAGGVYTFCREVFGYDQGFLTSWFASVTYLAILWANATSLPLFGRIFLGGIFQVGKMYTIFGYDVYLGEALLSMGALLLFGLLCTRHRRVLDRIMIALAGLFTAAIVITFVTGMIGHTGTFAPAFIPDSAALSQIVKIAVISPWAFIGFESISHFSEEYDFPQQKILSVLIVSVISTALLYIFITLLSVTAYPPQFSSWLEYMRNLGQLSGIEALPAFYAASHYLGNIGVWMLMLALLALVITSLIGNISALSRLFYALARDHILPVGLADLNEIGVPYKSVLLVAGISCLIPLVGRTAIGWIVDVTTIGAVLLYSFVSYATETYAKSMGERRYVWTGRIGLIAMVLFGALFLLPNLIMQGSLERGTYFLFIIWSVFGFLFFRYILHRDKKKRFGSSVSVWLVLLTLVLIISLIWMRQSMISSYDSTVAHVEEYYAEQTAPVDNAESQMFMMEKLNELDDANMRTMVMAIGMFGFALFIMLTNHSFMDHRSKENERIANRDPMTGVLNKHAYLNKERELDSHIEDAEAGEFAIVVCDVNGLKKINDTLGHKAGDEYIRKACTMICDIFQHSPVFRIGGDEFVSILTGRDYVIRKELMMALHDRSVDHIGSDDAVVSGGIADYEPGSDHDVHTIFERADAAMYTEKQLLKGMGAVTRDDTADEEFNALQEQLAKSEPIINIRKHILVVEDNEINQQLLGAILEEDYDILYASDGGEAMETIKEHKEDLALVMLDLVMPQMSGQAVLKAMKDDPDLSVIPVIVLTADQEAEVECLKLGAMDFISKPYPIWEIVKARVNKCIELSEDRSIIQSTERDSLTKLFNINYFYRYVKLFDQHYNDKPMDAVVLDINSFHLINERYGKQYGDMVLRRIGERLRTVARELGGVGCRQSGDTFLLYSPHHEDYIDILSRISESISTVDEASANRIRLRLGVYADADKSMDIERRFDRAKLAADSVKTGFNAIGIYSDDMGETAMYEERLLEDYRDALDQGQFTVFFQPKFDIRPDKPILASAEALVRWNHPELGRISPGIFIPLLEENGLILDLDKFVWRETAAQIRSWKDTYGFSVPISVNVSRIDMLTPNLKSVFQEILDTYALTPDDIILEVTESAYTGESDQVISTARELRSMGMGFRIEMDDFGTGYSSLGMLTHLPIDALKLDMAFIRNAFDSDKDVRMIELIIDIADYLHVPIVAEGVETEEQYLILKSLGCDMIQGYYFSRPVPKEEFVKFLIERKSQSVEVTPAVKKSYLSISKALRNDFQAIYNIDTLTDYYLEFFSDDHDQLQIRRSEEDFFQTEVPELLRRVSESDRPRLTNALGKDTLMKWVRQTDPAPVVYTAADGRKYSLQAIQTRTTDNHHIVIGICEEQPA